MNFNPKALREQHYLFVVVASMLTFGGFIFDLLTPLRMATSFVYVGVILVTFWATSHTITYIFSIITTVLTLIRVTTWPELQVSDAIIFNRALTLAGLWLATFFVIQFKNSQKAFSEEKERFEALFKYANEGIIVIDRRGVINMANPSVQELFGYQVDEILGVEIEQLIPSRFKEVHKAHRESYNQNPRSRQMGEGYELYGMDRDGREFPVEVSLSYFILNGQLNIIAFIIDVTERKKNEEAIKIANEELKRSNEELEQFAYVASHDLQEPLRMVSSYTKLLSERYQAQLDQEGNEFIQYVINGTERMKILCNNLVEYSRVGTQKAPFHQVSMKEVVDKALQNLQATINEQRAEVNVSSELPTIYGDQSQLIRLMQNLIGNAVKYRKKDVVPIVNIDVEESDRGFIFSIQDNGIGMDPKFKERVFMIFQSLHKQNAYEGAGMGLAICKKIVERHGGEIWFDSANDHGTTFYVFMPQ